MSERRLIVTADDVGLHPAMTSGAIEGHRRGIVTACSVVANGAAFDEAVERLREVPSLEVGVHLTLVGERPVSDPKRIRSLVSKNGSLHTSYVGFVRRYAAGAIRLAEVERELRAQLERVKNSDLAITHLNSHQHLHMLPAVHRLVVSLANEMNIAYVRTVNDLGATRGSLRRVSIAALSALGRRARRTHVATRSADQTIGVGGAGHLDEPTLLSLLTLVRGTVELVTHPASDQSPSNQYAWQYDWTSELAALTSSAVRQRIAERRIALIAPSAV